MLPAIPSQLLIRHIPDRGEHLVRYYGWYSSRCRGERRRMLEASEAEAEQQATIAVDEQLDPVLINAVRSTRARLIKKVHEVDPLICPHCGEEMRFLAVIEEQPVIEKILRHIKAWDPRPPLRAPHDDDWPENSRIPLTYHPVPDIACVISQLPGQFPPLLKILMRVDLANIMCDY